jgi:chromosome segregation ATPase
MTVIGLLRLAVSAYCTRASSEEERHLLANATRHKACTDILTMVGLGGFSMPDTSSAKRFDTLEEKLDQLSESVDARFGQMDKRFEQVDGRFEQVDGRFEQVDARFEQVDARFEQVDARFGQVDARFGQLDERLAAIDRQFEAIHKEFREVQGHFVEQREYTEFAYERLDRRLTQGFSRLERRLDQVIDAQSRPGTATQPRSRPSKRRR